MGRHLPGLGEQDANPFEELAWNPRYGDGVLRALRLLAERAKEPRPTPGPASSSLEHGRRTAWALHREPDATLRPERRLLEHRGPTDLQLDLLRQGPGPEQEDAIAAPLPPPDARTVAEQGASAWLDEQPLVRSTAPLRSDVPGRTVAALTERCFWRGYGRAGGFEHFGSRGLPTPQSVLTARAYPGHRRLRQWVDCLLAAVVPIRPDASVFAPDCGDGHILVRALERADGERPSGDPAETASSLRCVGISRRSSDLKRARLRTLLHGMHATSVGDVGREADEGPPGSFDVALLNVANDRPDRGRGRGRGREGLSDRALSSSQRAAEVRAGLVEEILDAMAPDGVAAVALPMAFGRRGEGQRTDELRAGLVEQGRLRVVLELPGRAGILLILEGEGWRPRWEREGDVLFITSPERWRSPSRLAAPQTSRAHDPLIAFTELVARARRGELAAGGHDGRGRGPSSRWVSRSELAEQGYELRPERITPGDHEKRGVLARPQVAQIREKLARLEKLRSEVDQEMDALLDELARRP